MKILVSGGTGFLGSKVVKDLLNKGHEITVLHRENYKIVEQNNRNLHYLKYKEIYSENNLDDYEAIFYCATKYSYKKGKIIELLDANLILPLKLLKIAYRSRIKYFINIDTIIDKNLNEYSTSKSSLRYWIQKFDGSINIVNIRIDHFFGPGDKSSKFIFNFHQSSSGIATASSVQVREPAHTRSIGRWRNYQKELQPMITTLEKMGVPLD